MGELLIVLCVLWLAACLAAALAYAAIKLARAADVDTAHALLADLSQPVEPAESDAASAPFKGCE